jgi:O-antigen/teichoic acid export membrane protein
LATILARPGVVVFRHPRTLGLPTHRGAPGQAFRVLDIFVARAFPVWIEARLNPSDANPRDDGEATPGTSSDVAEPLDEAAIRRRGSAAMFYVLSWGFANLAITFVGSLVLARLLTPREFGLVAIGQTVATLGSVAAEGGIASGFIRQPTGVPRPVLRSINGFQLVITLALAVIVTPIALQFGLAGAITALMVWSLPLASPQMAGRVVLYRELRFRSVALIEAMGVFAYFAWAITWALAGWGVWSLASGALVRTGTLTLAVAGVVGWRTLVPSLARYRDVLAVVGFGIRFSVFNLTNVLYDQGKNIVIASVGGTQALGLWALTARIVQIPYLVYQPINQVAFPAFSQLIAAGRDPRPELERVTRLSFAASTLMLPAFVAAVPGLISTFFGSQWNDAALIIPGIAISFFIGAPVGAVCIQFMFAVGRPSEVVRVTLIASATNLVCIALLLWTIGISGVGFGTIPGAALESFLLARLVRQLNNARLFSSMPVFAIAALLAAASGFAVGSTVGRDIAGAVAAAAAAVALALVVCGIAARPVLLDLLRVARRSASTALAGGD